MDKSRGGRKWAYSVGQQADSSYLIAGSASSGINWAKTFGGASYDEMSSIVKANDGGYALGGWTAG